MGEQQNAEAVGTNRIVGKDGPNARVTTEHQSPASIKLKPPPKKALWLLLIGLMAVGGLGFLAWKFFSPAKLPAGFASSNGRIEATETDVATKLAGRILKELVDEGDFVNAGQIVAHMDIESLQAQHREAVAQL